MKVYANAFDLIEDEHQSSLLKLKSNYMNQIVDIIKVNNITQKEAAKVMGVTQPRVSDLFNGKISKLSLDMLFTMHSKVIKEYVLISINKVPHSKRIDK